MRSTSFVHYFLLSFILLTLSTTHAANDDTDFLKEIVTIVDPNEAQWEIRNHIHDDENKCLELFKDAMQHGNSVAQLYCANAYYAMQWDKERAEAQGALKTSDMKAYNFVLNTDAGTFSERLNDMYRIVKPQMTKKKVLKKRKKVMIQAAKTGNPFAQLALIDAQRCRKNPLHFGHACKLRELRKVDGTFPFEEAIEMYRLAIQNAQKYNCYYQTIPGGTIPVDSFNLFEQHDMQEVIRLIRASGIQQKENDVESSLHFYRWWQGPDVTLRRNHATNTISVTYKSENAYYEVEALALANFIKDAWSRCSDDDIKGILEDIKEYPEAFRS